MLRSVLLIEKGTLPRPHPSQEGSHYVEHASCGLTSREYYIGKSLCGGLHLTSLKAMLKQFRMHKRLHSNWWQR